MKNKIEHYVSLANAVDRMIEFATPIRSSIRTREKLHSPTSYDTPKVLFFFPSDSISCTRFFISHKVTGNYITGSPEATWMASCF